MYSGSQASSKDMSLLFSSSFKHPEVDLQKNREDFDSDLSLHHQVHHHQQQQQMNSGLMRYRSAPSTLIANFVDGVGESDGCEDFLHPRSSSPEAESMFARFMTCAGNGDSTSPDLREIGEKSPVSRSNSQFTPSIEHETEVVVPHQQMIYHTVPPSPLSNHSSAANSAIENSYRVENSSAMGHSPAVKTTAGGNCSNLIRHSSSPAGLFSHLTVENGYPVMRGMGNFRAGNATNGDLTPSTSRFKGQINFSSGPPSTSTGLMSQISEIGSESISGNSPEDGSLGNSSGSNRCYTPGFPIGSWDDTSLVSENFNGLKRFRENEEKMFSSLNPSESQNGDGGNHPPPLAHHFSLPKTSAEMATMEKLLQFQHSVPCKIRAKRGCATHPRSIAERVRRTRISERMRKLQELVPNMDKQTNTADMLDLAVEYIKDLQKEVKKLSDKKANCTCSSKQKPQSNPPV